MTSKAAVLAHVEAELHRSRLTAHLRLATVAHDDDIAVHHAARALRLGADPTAIAGVLADHCDLHEE